jgi:cell volume regulation protein A
VHTLYLILPTLLIAVVIASVWLERWSVLVILVALGTGIVFGSDVLRLWDFDNMLLANQCANLALVFILFHGGFMTKGGDFRAVALPAGGLATWGGMLTSAVTFVILHWGLGWSMELSLLLAVIISSTDAAANFSILRHQSLPKNLSSTVEIESTANVPMAILLTTIAVGSLVSGDSLHLSSGSGICGQHDRHRRDFVDPYSGVHPRAHRQMARSLRTGSATRSL